MPSQSVRIPITNVILGSDYTGQIQLGSAGTKVNVILDTGSSTLAVDHKAYDPSGDTSAKTTDLVQAVQYGSGSWIGSVVNTTVSVGGAGGDSVTDVPLAVAYHESVHMFSPAQGILGLGFEVFDTAYDIGKPSIPPHYTPNQIQASRHTVVTPYFNQLASEGEAPKRQFAFLTKRSWMHVAPGVSTDSDPLNQGILVLGGGEEATDLYRAGTLQTVTVLSDDWFSVNLKQVIVGTGTAMNITPPTKAQGIPTNAIVDSGTNSLVLSKTLFDAIVEHLTPVQRAAISRVTVQTDSLNLAAWPTISFVLQGANGDVKLEVPPQNYWQVDALEQGVARCSLVRTAAPQSILGLPLMNGYFTIFDLEANSGLGAVMFGQPL